MYKPIFKRPEDEISKKIEDKIKSDLSTRVEGVKTDVVDRVKAGVEIVRSEVDEKVKVKVEERMKEETEKVRKEIDNKVKSEVDKRIVEILKEREEKEKVEKAEKIAKAVDVAKAIKSDTEKERLEKNILCPTCKTGHVHRAETDKSGLVYKCTGKDCGFEAALVAKDSDFKCTTCGMPLKKPEDPKSMDGCPFCHGARAVRFDWSKLWNVKKK